ncbi:hypothetical protein HYY70_04010 [Candidatus Woesearchaeota archaeon]|nr:hypothetical protein [Candidatus Woesearchaeota archaeon]
MLEDFAKEKSDFLKKSDKSKKGCIDKGILKIINLFNSKSEYYTTSSCAGRIVLLERKSKKKSECDWILTKHSKVAFDEIASSLKKHKIKNEIWLKQQPIILHVACINLDAAKKLLEASRKIFKHSGIISITKRRIVIEIIGNEKVEAIIADKDFAADEEYIKHLTRYANRNFEENKSKSDKFLSIIKKL